MAGSCSSMMQKNRLEAFSDGIIAFAITLLVLDIRIPELKENVDNQTLFHALLSLVPYFGVYVASFLICTVWWISHHAFINDLQHVNRQILWLNSLFLMWIAFLPFPTSLLGHHPGQPLATAFYGTICTVTGISFTIMRWYASLRGRLIKSDISETQLRFYLRLSIFGPAFYMIGTIMAFFAPSFAMLIYVSVPVYFAWVRIDGQ